MDIIVKDFMQYNDVSRNNNKCFITAYVHKWAITSWFGQKQVEVQDQLY